MKYRHQRNFKILQHTINHKVAEMNRLSIHPCGRTLFEKIRFMFSYAEDWQIYSIINLFLVFYEQGDASFSIRPDHSICIFHGSGRQVASLINGSLINGYSIIIISKSTLSVQIKTKSGTEEVVFLKIVRN